MISFNQQALTYTCPYCGLPQAFEGSYNFKDTFYDGQFIIDSLRNAVVSYYDSYHYKQIEGQYISINPQKVQDDQIANYMCLFPRRSLIETSALYTYLDMTPFNGEEYDMPPDDFIKQYFRFNKIIDNNIAYLYPVRRDEESSRLDCAVFDSSVILPIKNIADVSQNGDIKRIVEQSDMFYMSFPWLYNARLDDFMDICDKYPAEFDCLALTIEKIANASNTGSDLQKDVLKELKDALVNIQISFEKRKSELRSKGIATFVGLALTFIPFAAKNYFDNFDPTLLQTILGSTSLLSSKGILEDFFSQRHGENINPYWVIWKWKEKTMKEVN